MVHYKPGVPQWSILLTITIFDLYKQSFWWAHKKRQSRCYMVEFVSNYLKQWLKKIKCLGESTENELQPWSQQKNAKWYFFL